MACQIFHATDYSRPVTVKIQPYRTVVTQEEQKSDSTTIIVRKLFRD